MSLAYIYVECPTCEWRSATYYAGPSARMMGVLTAGNDVEDDFDRHYAAAHATDAALTEGGATHG